MILQKYWKIVPLDQHQLQKIKCFLYELKKLKSTCFGQMWYSLTINKVAGSSRRLSLYLVSSEVWDCNEPNR